MHSDLITKLEGLDGPSREVDAEISERFNEFAFDWSAPPFSQSLDWTIALTERVLPGWSWEARKSGFGNGQASVWDPMDQPRPGTTIRADHKSSPAIALLIAALKALEARDG